MELTRNDLDALKRALRWGKAFQTREPQLRVWPEVLPDEGSPAWIALAMYFVRAAHADNLGLRPWETEPCATIDDGEWYIAERMISSLPARQFGLYRMWLSQPDLPRPRQP